jgi:hypothetical protein
MWSNAAFMIFNVNRTCLSALVQASSEEKDSLIEASPILSLWTLIHSDSEPISLNLCSRRDEEVENKTHRNGIFVWGFRLITCSDTCLKHSRKSTIALSNRRLCNIRANAKSSDPNLSKREMCASPAEHLLYPLHLQREPLLEKNQVDTICLQF